MTKLELKLDIDKLNLTEEDKKETPQQIITSVILNVILAYSQQIKGLNNLERKQYYIIRKNLEEASKNNFPNVEFENDTYLGFIKKCFREGKLTPNGLLEQVEILLGL